MARKKIAVLGGGPAGICCVKCIREEDMDPVCFEKTGHTGGLWRYHEEDIEGIASVMKTTVINSSKELSAISDFPPAEHLPNYMHNRQVCQMLNSYAEAFDLVKYVQFYKEVVEVDFADDYEETGRLVVTVRDTKTLELSKDTYDGVMVCIGHHVYPNMPSLPGMENFKGTVMHTHSLKKVDIFEDKVVVVVGVGNSGMDAAAEISAVAKQVYLSTRRGAWILPRIGPWGMPFDLFMTRRWLDMLFKWLPYDFNCWISETMLNRSFDHETYNIKPNHRIWSQHPTVSDTLPIKILTGTVLIKKDIQKFVENGVIFEGENSVTECDSVVLATGYKVKFPFLNEKIMEVKNNKVHLYKYVFPPYLKHSTLCIVGLIQSVGGGFPIGEAQARWAALVFNGKLSLPSAEDMEADIKKKEEINDKRYTKSERHTIQVDYIDYLDEIYSIIGAKPNFFKMMFSDPVLFWTLLFGPSLPYQYRLQGPHRWPGARKAILEWKKRTIKPLNDDGTNRTWNMESSILKSIILVLLVPVLIGIVIKFFM